MFHIVLYYVFCSVGSIFIGFCCAFSPCICDNPHKTAINCPSNFFDLLQIVVFLPVVSALLFYDFSITKSNQKVERIVKHLCVQNRLQQFRGNVNFYFIPCRSFFTPGRLMPCSASSASLPSTFSHGRFLHAKLVVSSFFHYILNFFTLCVCLLRLQRAVLGCDWCGWGCCDWDGCWHCCLRFRRTMRYIHCEFVCNGNGNGG